MTASVLQFSDTVPAAGAGHGNVAWQNDGGLTTVNISAEFPDALTLSNFTEELVAFTGTAGTLAHTPTLLIGLFRNGVRQNSLGGSPDFTIAGAAVTLTIAAVGTDQFVAVYIHA